MQGSEGLFLPVERKRCQYLFNGVIRNWRLLRTVLDRRVRRQPKPKLRAVLLLGAFEILDNREDAGRIPRIVDHAVEQANRRLSRAEAGMVNAVLRVFPESLDAVLEGLDRESVEAWAIRMSHPDWLVARWVRAYGWDAARALLEWNQKPPETYIRVAGRDTDAALPDGIEETAWPDFLRVTEGGWPVAEEWIREGRGYIQDPGTGRAPEAADVQPGERVLDLCSAPGGKARILLERAPERIVCVDHDAGRLGERHRQWVENLDRFAPVVHRIEGDLLDAMTRRRIVDDNGSGGFDAVLLDVPCSNTGVIRRRPEVRWRLKPEAIRRFARVQRELLEHASGFVRPGGRLIYSTCSIEHEENGGVVDAFCESNPGSGFHCVSARTCTPMNDGHDGAGVFRLVSGS